MSPNNCFMFTPVNVADRAPELRDRLILHYAPLVKYVAGRVSSGLPAHVEQADLVSYGTFGLIEMLIFVAILALGLLYAWRKKVLRWV